MKEIPVISGLNAFGKRVSRDAVAAYAGETALFIIISFFPFVMFLLSIFRFLPFAETDLVMLINLNLPEDLAEPVIFLLDEIYATSTTVVSISVITLIWSASRGMLSVIRGLNSVYQIPETRNYFLVRLISIFYMLIFTVIIILTLGLSVFGTTIKRAIEENIPETAERYFQWLHIVDFRVILNMSVLFVFFVLFYTFVPNRKTKIIYEVPGALVTSVGWTAFSHLYSYYIGNLAKHTYMYGSLTAAVFLVLWLYFCFYIMFIGAEISSLIREYYPNYYKFRKK